MACVRGGVSSSQGVRGRALAGAAARPHNGNHDDKGHVMSIECVRARPQPRTPTCHDLAGLMRATCWGGGAES
jgi:hypothetical protein